ncbi:MAG: hypothetical protein K5764_00860 [Prevotella sp.]|nr:hypothetical protein [Prevotella sp.]
MDSMFSDWKAALQKLQDSVSKDLAEIRKQKAEIQKIKEEVFNELEAGRYIRDDNRLVISAPEIIIGNVDKCGNLLSQGGSTVILRGTNVGIEASGVDGIIKTRASNIEQCAIDPGPDGIEEVVHPQSVISSQAKHIVLQSNESEGFFSQRPTTVGTTGIHLHADDRIVVDACQSVENRKKAIEDQLKDLNAQKGTLTQESSSRMSEANDIMGEMEKLLGKQDKYRLEVDVVRTSVVDLDELQEQFRVLAPAVHNAVKACIDKFSDLAEVNRRITALEAEKKNVESKSSNFLTQTTNASLQLLAEHTDILSVDGDGNIRTNEGSVINMQARDFNLTTQQQDGQLIEGSSVKVNTENVHVSTVNTKRSDDKNATMTTGGTCRLQSKKISIDAVDIKKSNDKMEETGLVKDSALTITMETVNILNVDKEKNAAGAINLKAKDLKVLSVDKDGNATGTLGMKVKDMTIVSTDKDENATGTFSVKAETITGEATDKSGAATGQVNFNAKNVYVKAMDTDGKGADKSLAGGGSVTVVGEKMYVGRSTKANTSKELLIASDKTAVCGTSTTEVQQGSGKAVVQLDGGNLSMSGSKTQLYGATTVNGKADFKGDVSAPKVSAKNLEASSSFKSPNISDGMAMPGGGAGGSLSAKLKESDAPKGKAVEVKVEVPKAEEKK